MVEKTIDLNTADAEELTDLSGIGPVLAQRIVAHRETVGPYKEPADIVAVPGIGQRSYGAIADRLTAMGPAEGPPPATGEIFGGTGDSVTREEEAAAEEGAVEAIPPEESIRVGELPPERTASGGARDDTVQPAVAPASPRDSDEAVPDHGQSAGKREKVGEAVGASTEDEASWADGSPSPLRGARTLAGSPQGRRPLSWLWIAVVGGLLGMVFALIAFAGINGSLDIGHSRAVLGIEADVDALTRDLDALSVDVEGLGRRIEALEGLRTRMDMVESSVDELRREMSDLGAQTDALAEEVDGLSRELEAVTEDVAVLQREAERTRSFFDGLQGLLDDVFGGAEAESSPTATPEGK